MNDFAAGFFDAACYLDEIVVDVRSPHVRCGVERTLGGTWCDARSLSETKPDESSQQRGYSADQTPTRRFG